MAEPENTVVPKFGFSECTSCRRNKPVIHIGWRGGSSWEDHSYTKCLPCYLALVHGRGGFNLNVAPRIRELFAE